jgi:transposase
LLTSTSIRPNGTVRAATLLAEIGDARGRFPTEEALAAAAGISPSTRASGRSRSVVFRRACNYRLRSSLVDGRTQAAPPLLSEVQMPSPRTR